ncbi:MAG: hypothetical protein ACRC6T_08540 [Sarcina sp.]
MKDNITMGKTMYYSIVGLCALIIMANSIETFIKVKDIGLFELWFTDSSLNPKVAVLSENAAYSVYLNMCLSEFLIKVITPVGLALNTYFSFIKLGVSRLFVRIWAVLLIGLFAFNLIGETFFSVFFIVSTGAYLILVSLLFYLGKEINRQININVMKKLQ